MILSEIEKKHDLRENQNGENTIKTVIVNLGLIDCLNTGNIDTDRTHMASIFDSISPSKNKLAFG